MSKPLELSVDMPATALGNGFLSTFRRRLEYIDSEFQQVSGELDAGFKKIQKTPTSNSSLTAFSGPRCCSRG